MNPPEWEAAEMALRCPIIIRTGARVTRIDEEGYVGLFLYKHDTILSFKVPDGTLKAWANRLGDFVTIVIADEKLDAVAEIPRQASLTSCTGEEGKSDG